MQRSIPRALAFLVLCAAGLWLLWGCGTNQPTPTTSDCGSRKDIPIPTVVPLPTGAPITQATWVAGPDMAFCRGSLAAATGSVYALGGFDGPGNPLTTAEVYTPNGGNWTSLPGMPTKRGGLAAVHGSNGLIYALGGCIPQQIISDTQHSCLNSSSVITDVVEAYDPGAGTWTNAGHLARAVAGAAAVTDGQDTLYVIGGLDSQHQVTNGLQVCSLPLGTGTITCTLTTSMSTPRWYLAAAYVVDGGQPSIYAMGGFDQTGTPLNTVEIYDVTKHSWSTTSKSLPAPTAKLSVVPIVSGGDTLLLAIGGIISPSQGITVTGNVSIYDLNTEQWSTGPPLLTARAAMGAAVFTWGESLATPTPPPATPTPTSPTQPPASPTPSKAPPKGSNTCVMVADGQRDTAEYVTHKSEILCLR